MYDINFLFAIMCDKNMNLLLILLPIVAQWISKKVNVLGLYFQDKLILIACNVLKGIESNFQVKSNLVIRNFLVTLILFLNPKCSLSILVTGNGSLTPICSLLNRSLSPSSTVLMLFKWATKFFKQKRNNLGKKTN